MLSVLTPPPLSSNSGDVKPPGDKLQVLMKRLGIESLPPHDTLWVPLERIVVPGADLVRPSARLVRSIKTVGVLQSPAVVLRTGTGIRDATATFEVIFGRRRVLGAHLAGLREVKCEVYASGTPQLASLLALIENEQRSSAWIKEVQDLRRLIDEKVGMTPDDLAAFGFDRGSLADRLKIAQLPLPLLTHVLAGKMTLLDAKKLTRLMPAQLSTLERLILSGEELTPDLVKSTLRAQINNGLVPLQGTLESLHEGGGPNLEAAAYASVEDRSAPAVSLEALLLILQSFERALTASAATQNLRLLTKALIQEVKVASRASTPILKATQEDVYA